MFAFSADARNLEILPPPWMNFQIHPPWPIGMGKEAIVQYTICWRGLPLRVLTESDDWRTADRFVDAQREGPYRLWRRTQAFRPCGAGTAIEDVLQVPIARGNVVAVPMPEGMIARDPRADASHG